MKTAVVQSFRSHNEPGWMQLCRNSVEAWAAQKGFDYLALDGSEEQPSVLSHDRRHNLGSADLSRFRLARSAATRGYDRALWLDPEVLVFHPELLNIGIYEEHAFLRETRAPIAEGQRWTGNFSTSAVLYVRGAPDLEPILFIKAMAVLPGHKVRAAATRAMQIARRLRHLSYHRYGLRTLDGFGRLGKRAARALVDESEDALAAQAIAHGTPIFAARIDLQGHGEGVVSNPDAESSIRRLLDSRGDIVNRWLLLSPDNLKLGCNPGMSALFPQEALVRLQFKQTLGYEPDLANPRTFNERLTARKITLVDEIYRTTADKYAARKFVEDRVGKGVLIPLLQVCDRAEDVDFEALPRAFILKATHGSGWSKVVWNKARSSEGHLRSTMREWLGSNYFDHKFEIHYRDIAPRIIVEELLNAHTGRLPEDYRFNVFNGRVCFISVNQDRGTLHARVTRFDPSWRLLLVRSKTPPADNVPPPICLAEMIDMAVALARDFEYARVDLYCVRGKVYFGEITHTPLAGLNIMMPPDFDAALGRIWETGEPIPERFYASSGDPEAGGSPPARSRKPRQR